MSGSEQHISERKVGRVTPFAFPAMYLLPLGALAIYVAFLTKTYYWDGVLFAINIEGFRRGDIPATVLFHPNHLLYSALGYIVYAATVACGIHTRAITVLQVFNAFLGVAAAWLLYGLARRLTGSAVIALFSSVLFAFGATWWKYSTDADSYIIAVLLILAAMTFLVGEEPRILPAIIWYVAAMLFHELAIFAFVPIAAAIFLNPRRRLRVRASLLLAYGTGSALCVTAVYWLCYMHTDHLTYPTLRSWITSYAANSGFTHSFRQIAGAYLNGYVKLFGGGKLAFLREYFSIASCLGLCICLAAICGAIYLWRHPNANAPGYTERKKVLVLWVWFLVYAVFLASFDPGSTFHLLFLWPPLVLLIAKGITARKSLRERGGALVGMAVALAAWNFSGYIYPHSHASADPVLMLAQTVDRELPPHATVYYAALDPDDWYVEYFAPGRNWRPLPAGTSVTDLLRQAPSGTVCLDMTALRALHAPLHTTRRWDLVNSHHDIRLECVDRGK